MAVTMYASTENREKLLRIVALMARVPDNTWYDIDTHLWPDGPRLRFQAETQEKVRAIRALFPGVFWAKSYDEPVQWWTYDGTYDGIAINIYAVKEAPPTCHAVEEEYEVEEYDFGDAQRPPLKKVMKKRLRYVCSEEAA